MPPPAAATSRSQAVMLKGVIVGSQPVTKQKIVGSNDMKMEVVKSRTPLGVYNRSLAQTVDKETG